MNDKRAAGLPARGRAKGKQNLPGWPLALPQEHPVGALRRDFI